MTVAETMGAWAVIHGYIHPGRAHAMVPIIYQFDWTQWLMNYSSKGKIKKKSESNAFIKHIYNERL